MEEIFGTGNNVSWGRWGKNHLMLLMVPSSLGHLTPADTNPAPLDSLLSFGSFYFLNPDPQLVFQWITPFYTS